MNIIEKVKQLKDFDLLPTQKEFQTLAKELQKKEPSIYKTYNNALDGISAMFGKRKYQAIKPKIKDVCRWIYAYNPNKSLSVYTASCGFDFTLTDGNAKENGMNFCSSCGKKIVEYNAMNLLLRKIYTIYFDKEHTNKISIQTSLEKESLVSEILKTISMINLNDKDVKYTAREVIEYLFTRFDNIVIIDYDVVKKDSINSFHFEDIYIYNETSIDWFNFENNNLPIPLKLLAFIKKESNYSCLNLHGQAGIGKTFIFNKLKETFINDICFIDLIEDFPISKLNPICYKKLKDKIIKSNCEIILIDEATLLRHEEDKLLPLLAELKAKNIKIAFFSQKKMFYNLGLSELVEYIAIKRS